ncbi:MAG: hypothetical protein ABII75_04790 [Candidatus Omnitrophota bacterium]
MNIAFICTGEFEPFLYECIAKQLEKDDIHVYYAAFFLNIRRAIRRVNRRPYPEQISPGNLSGTDLEKQSVFDRKTQEQIIEYDYLRLHANGQQIKQETLIRQVLNYERFFADFYQEKDIGAIVIWNYFPIMVNVAWRLARKMNLKTIFFENGPLRNTLLIDTHGINYQSSLTQKKRSFYEQVVIDDQLWMPFIIEYKIGRQKLPRANKGIMSLFFKFGYALLMRNRFYRRRFPDLAADTIMQSVYKKLYSKYLLKEKTLVLPEKFVFLPLQCSCDTQILINSSNIKNMDDFVKIAYRAIKKALPKDYKIVVKETPDDWGRINYEHLKKRYPDIIWLQKCNISDLIEKADLIVTINSSVAIEALTYYKPVVTLGLSYFNIEGVVYHVRDLDNFEDILKTAVKESVNQELINKFLYYLRFKYLVPGSPAYCDEPSLTAAYNRIKKILLENN